MRSGLPKKCKKGWNDVEMDNKIDLYYFSGTGNTKIVTDIISNSLISKDFKVNIYEIEKGFQPDSMASKIIFAFPANSQAVSPLVWKFFKTLPEVSGADAYLLTTLNESVYITRPLYNLLKRKGYNPKVSCMISMPNNMLDTPADENQDRQMIEKALVKAQTFINCITSETQFHDTEYTGARIVSFLSRNTALPWFFMRQIFKLDTNKEKCSNCGLCKNRCPVGNIKHNDYPIHGYKCEFCMRCVSNCSNKAIYIKGKENIAVRKYSAAIKGQN